MGKRTYNESRAKANKKYDAKTYKQISILLRKEEDKDIIESLEQAQSEGISYREWIRSLVNK